MVSVCVFIWELVGGPKKMPATLLGVPKHSQARHHNVYAEDPAETHVASMIAASVNVSPYESCLVDSMGYTLLVSLNPLAPTIYL